MKKRTYILVWAIIAIILIPIIFFPISSDLAIYVLGGKSILAGAKLYVDFIDLKPPFIYLTFACITSVFGSSEFQLRLFDFLMQSATIISIFFVVSKLTSKKNEAIIASLVYAAMYSTLGYSQTLQCESFTGIFLIWLIYLQAKDKTYTLLIRGILIGVIAALKYSTALLFLAIIIDDLLRSEFSIKKICLRQMLIFLGFVLVNLGIFSIFLDPEIWQGYSHVLKYLGHYTSLPPYDFFFIRSLIKETGRFFGDNYSFLFSIATLIGISYSIRRNGGNIQETSPRLLKLCSLTFVVLFFSALVEKKIGGYYFSRMYVPLSILASFGIIGIYRWLINSWKDAGVYSKFLLIMVFAAGVIFSPLSRWIHIAEIPYYYITNIDKYDNYFESTEGSANLRVQQKAVATEVNSKIKTGDKVIVMSTGSAEINYFLKTDNISRFAQSQFYFSTTKIPEWQNAIFSEMQSALCIVIQTNDNHLFILGHQDTSWDSMQKERQLFDYLSEHFYLCRIIGNFRIYYQK